MRCGPLLQVIRGAVTTSLSQAVVLSTDVVAKWEAKECILCQPGPLYDDAHAPTNNHASSFTGAATLDGLKPPTGRIITLLLWFRHDFFSLPILSLLCLRTCEHFTNCNPSSTEQSCTKFTPSLRPSLRPTLRPSLRPCLRARSAQSHRLFWHAAMRPAAVQPA